MLIGWDQHRDRKDEKVGLVANKDSRKFTIKITFRVWVNAVLCDIYHSNSKWYWEKGNLIIRSEGIQL